MKLLKRVYKNDEYETVIETYKCCDGDELRRFIKDNIENILTLDVDFRRGNKYIIQILDCIVAKDIKIKKLNKGE